MRKLSFFLLSALGIFLFSCSVKEPQFQRIENIRVGQLGLKETSVTLDILYYNPNKFRVKLKKAQGEAWVDSLYLGHFSADTLIHIKPNSEFTIPVTLQMDMASLLLNSATLLAKKEVLVRIEGSARVGKGLFFIHYPIHYQGKQSLGSIIH